MEYCLSTSMDQKFKKAFITTKVLQFIPYTYPQELEHYSIKREENSLPSNIQTHPQGREKLFHKVVTMSDIKQYRLALPKNEVKNHFPMCFESTSKGALMCMEDTEGKLWRFRFTFWKSCQGFVFTSQWNQFVKDKGLNAGDVVSFSRSIGPDAKLYIEWEPQSRFNINIIDEPEATNIQQGRVFKLFGVNIVECDRMKLSGPPGHIIALEG